MRATFSFNHYDSDGDCVTESFNIHLNDNITIHFKDLKEFREFIQNLFEIDIEVKENYET